jgi:enterochelin esterase-like enzyme
VSGVIQISNPLAPSLHFLHNVWMRRLTNKLYIPARIATVFVLLITALSLLPGDGAYYHIESFLSSIGPLGVASQHIRSIPYTAASLVMESFRSRVLEVEGVNIDLMHAVNPTHSVEKESFFSQALNEDRSYLIYLPPSYEDSGESYPTLYLLHGMSQGPSWWTEVARVGRIATSMIASGKIRPLIIVMPNGNRVERDVSTTSLYDNGCETGLDPVARVLKAIGDRLNGLRIYKVSCDGDFERYIARDVVREIDASYRTSGERYIGGFSIGGRGAVQLAFGNNGIFDGAFGLSGNYDFLRGELRRGAIDAEGVELFLASGDKDQRGLYGKLNTYLFHRDLAKHGIEHMYCTYEGTHSDLAWVSAMPQALEYLLAPAGPAELNGRSQCQMSAPEDATATPEIVEIRVQHPEP